MKNCSLKSPVVIILLYIMLKYCWNRIQYILITVQIINTHDTLWITNFKPYLDKWLIHRRWPTIRRVRDDVGRYFAGPSISIQFPTSCQSQNRCSRSLCFCFSKTNQMKSLISLSSTVYKQNIKKEKLQFQLLQSHCCVLVSRCILYSPSIHTTITHTRSTNEWLTLPANVLYLLVIFLYCRLGILYKYHGLLDASYFFWQVCALTKTLEEERLGLEPTVSFYSPLTPPLPSIF